jgi:hypothetical protein
MDLEFMKNRLATEGWKDIQPGCHMGIEFDLVGFRHSQLAKWKMLVKILPGLDHMWAEHWKTNFQTINNNSVGLLWGKFFLIALLAETVSDQISEALAADPVDLVGGWKFKFLKKGGGNVFIADLARKKIYGQVPRSPKDMFYFSRALQTVMMDAIDGTAVHPAPSGPDEAAYDFDTSLDSVSE